ncbi:uncharacterized protein LOC110822712 [Carica papaya]|uniref:uncharacterized protein LOC110822712 n=1 Tax=Carica papaya TaxID=3649 RepID=UPI000B8CECE2|nr:uncharacterized protein LOC110822712 [Carica papaya]
MGQTLKTLASGNEQEIKTKAICNAIEEFYNSHLENSEKEWTLTDFYRAICEVIEEINRKIGSTQFRVPPIETLDQAYKAHNLGGEKKTLTKDEFLKVLQEMVIGTGFTGVGGARDVLLFIFGVPVTALFLKHRIAPNSLPDDVFIPAVTSATVYLLAKLNKI